MRSTPLSILLATIRKFLFSARTLKPKHTGILLADLLCIVWATVGAQIARFGLTDQSLNIGGDQQAPYSLVSIAIILAWWAMLTAWGSRDEQVLGYGVEEYKRVVTGTLWLFGGIAVFSYVLQLETARGYVAIALPLGIISLLIARWTLRARLVAARRRGHRVQRLLLIGSTNSTAHLQRQLSQHLEAGYSPVAALTPDSDGPRTWSFPHKVDAVLTAIDECGASAVAITTGAPFDTATLRQLGWQLAAKNIGMIMAPALTDVTGPRIRTRPVAGLPLIHVTTPKLEGPQRVMKRTFDIVASVLILSLSALPMLIVALLVRLTSPGPALFRQTRVGRGGRPFEMLKFRSMIIDAEEKLEVLRKLNEGSGLLFKMKEDPRVTRVGRAIRRYSVDELPQLINVLIGEMSLVGPRPPLPSEVAAYDDFAHRRLLVKPGLTGLWQISGRSNLSWEDSIRLDLYYVENWSFTQDLMIIFKTIGAVLGKSGAY